MEDLRKFIGLSLIIIGAMTLISLAFNLESYVFEFKTGPIYTLLAEDMGENFRIAFNGNILSVDGGSLSIIALLFTFMFLNIWLKIGWTVLRSGSRIFSPELSALKEKIEGLPNKIKDELNGQ